MPTQTAAKTDTCATCKYWNPASADQGECRRRPPQAIVFKVGDDEKIETRFPTTQGSDWCGEHEA